MGGPVNHVKHLCSFGKLPVSAAYFGSMFATMNQLCSNLWQDHNFNHSSRHYGHRVDGNRSDFNTLTMKFSHLFAVFIFFFSFSLLWGPVNHVKHLCSFGRLPFTAAYFGSMFATLYMAIIVSEVHRYF